MRCFATLVTLCSVLVIARGQFTDNFSDGNFTAAPVWSGTTALFLVNAAGQLQLNGSGASTAYLTVPFEATALTSVSWQLSVRHAFSSSASNNSRVYLVSDAQDLSGAVHGYYLQFGEAGSDDAVTLFRQDGLTHAAICRGKSGSIAGAFSVTVGVVLLNGTWTIAVDHAGGNNLVPEAAGSDSTWRSCHFFGLVCNYTASNASKFYFDDFAITTSATETSPAPLPVAAGVKDVIITEIFPDPSPAVGLPSAEYVEIYNRSSSALDITGWTITDGTTSGLLPKSEANLRKTTY